MSVLVTGGTGYIGSHTYIALHEAGLSPVILDNLANSKATVIKQLSTICATPIPFYQGSCADQNLLAKIFKKHRIQAVCHFAAYKSVHESVSHPLRYYQNNVSETLALLTTMKQHGIRVFVFSSSATVYGEPKHSPIPESAPYNPAQPYGRSKQIIEQILADLQGADSSWCCIVLRYFNPVGAHPSGLIGEDPQGIPNNLTPFITQVAIGRQPQLSVFGQDYPTPDGTCLRDYIHVQDLAKGHVRALQACRQTPGYHVFNLGTGTPHSVLEVIKAFEGACQKPIPYIIAPRRAGDVAAYWADPTQAQQKLKWKAHLSLHQMAEDCWRWQSMFPHGLT